MSSEKNSASWFSFSMIAILLILFSMIAVYPSLAHYQGINSVEINYDLSKELEASDAEKDTNEESINLFYFEISGIKPQNTFLVLKGAQPVFLIPRMFYDIQILPPERLIG